MPLNQFKAIDLDNFLDTHPLNFLLFYGDYEVINTVYLDDGSPIVDLSVELFNQSPTQTVKFEKPNNLSASADNCHFFLELEGNFTLEEAPEGWDIAVELSRSNTGNNFYFLKRQAGELQPKAANGSTNKLVLVLKKFRAAPDGGTRTLRADLTYGPLLKDKNNQPFQDEHDQYFSYGNTIFITNNRGGKKTLPLQVDFAAGNAVINDGTATNSLELLIANKNWPSNNLSLSPDSEFVISFEMGDKEAAVATTAQVKNISIIGIGSNSNNWNVNWNVQHVTNSTEWTVKPKSGISQLASGEAIKLNITNLVTGNSSGAGYLYVRYKNIPNYPDGQFVVPLEKTPLLYRDKRVGTTTPAVYEKQVGIGINNPSAKLHVNGNIRLSEKIENGEDGRICLYTNTSAGKSDAWIELWGSKNSDSNRTGELVLAGKYIDFRNNSTQSADGSIGMRLTHEGKVGIGTTTPSEKLHVSGNAIVSGNVAIGTADANTLTVYGTITSVHSTRQLRVNNPIVATAFIGDGAVVTGMIVMWSGQIDQIPTGWALCNGYNGTPNLIDRFIVGAGSNKYSVGATGGAESVTLTINQMPAHTHNYERIETLIDGGGYFPANNNDSPHSWRSTTSTGGNQAHENRPPYYAMAFIMKIRI